MGSFSRNAALAVAVVAASLLGTAWAAKCYTGQDTQPHTAGIDTSLYRVTDGWNSCWRITSNGLRVLNGSVTTCSGTGGFLPAQLKEVYPNINLNSYAASCCSGSDLCNAASSLRPLALPMLLALLLSAVLGSALLA